MLKVFKKLIFKRRIIFQHVSYIVLYFICTAPLFLNPVPSFIPDIYLLVIISCSGFWIRNEVSVACVDEAATACARPQSCEVSPVDKEPSLRLSPRGHRLYPPLQSSSPGERGPQHRHRRSQQPPIEASRYLFFLRRKQTSLGVTGMW